MGTPTRKQREISTAPQVEQEGGEEQDGHGDFGDFVRYLLRGQTESEEERDEKRASNFITHYG